MAAGLAATGLAGCSSRKHAGAPDPPNGGAGAGDDGRSAPAARVTAPAPANVIGANLNQDLDALDFAQLQAVSATWVRAFYPMQDADQGDVANQPGLRKLTTAADAGYGTVLNLKFAYDQGLPQPGSPEMATALDRLDKVLAVVMGKVGILVVGNEPFYECGQQTGSLNAFYEAVAQHAIDFRKRHAGASGKTQIYMGALTGLENPRPGDVQFIMRWMEFVRTNPDIAGTDCHPHVSSLSDCQRYLNFIIPQLRKNQKFLATEFSLVKLYRRHMTDPAPPAFLNHYRLPPKSLVWQVVGTAIAHPFPQQQWNDFLLGCDWFSTNRTILTDMAGAFRQTGRLAVAGYGITQDTGAVSGWGPGKTPWVFNSVFCPYVTQSGSDGLPGQNVTWADEFRKLQHSQRNQS